MLARLRFLDPILIIGIGVSVVTALILVLIGQDQVASLLIGLVITVMTLLIDIIARLKESEERIVKISALGETLASEPSLFRMLQQITNDYRSVKEQNFDLFLRRMNVALTDCRDVLHGLSEGYLATDIYSEFSFGITGIKSVQKTLNAVQYANPAYWRTKFGEKYSQLNEEAVKRGVKVTRLWIQGRETLENFRDVITSQESMGIQVLLAESQDIPRDLREDFAIVDSKMLVKLEMTREGESKLERISIDPIEVEKAERIFELLQRYARTPSEYYRQGTHP
jgi:hypothetical protein